MCLCEESSIYIGCIFFFFQAEDGIRDLVRSRGLGDVYKRQSQARVHRRWCGEKSGSRHPRGQEVALPPSASCRGCLLYTSDAADERSSVDLGGRRIIKKKNSHDNVQAQQHIHE